MVVRFVLIDDPQLRRHLLKDLVPGKPTDGYAKYQTSFSLLEEPEI